jgi:hypothetical protein
MISIPEHYSYGIPPQCNLENVSAERRSELLKSLDDGFSKCTHGIVPTVQYFKIAGVVIRVEYYSPELIKVAKVKMAYTRCRARKHHDYLFRVWSGDLKEVGQNFDKDEVYHDDYPVVRFTCKRTRLDAYDSEKKIVHVAADPFSDIYLSDMTHIFVAALNWVFKAENCALVHGAVVGVGGQGALICGYAGRGKSTLAVSALLEGFQYVSDDYIILGKRNGKLVAHPIYSIVTLSPKIEAQMPTLEARYLCKNGSRLKNVLDISSYHDAFVDELPIVVAIFPEIATDRAPGIEKISMDKPLSQVVLSTLRQINECGNAQHVKFLASSMAGLPAYGINLSENLEENVAFLRKILTKRKSYVLNKNRIFYDVVDGIATIIDSKTGFYYGINKFGSQIFKYLIDGHSTEEILEELAKLPGCPLGMPLRLKKYVDRLVSKKILVTGKEFFSIPSSVIKFDTNVAASSNFYPIVEIYADGDALALAKPMHDISEDGKAIAKPHKGPRKIFEMEIPVEQNVSQISVIVSEKHTVIHP